jgi:hypothetical protein
MVALYRAGRQAEALGVYRAARRVLVDQLGIEPSEELRELERAILAQDPELAAPAPQQPPRRASSERSARGALVGYEHELGTLEDLLEQALTRQGRLALISGEPGVGKTRLADELGSVANARGAQVVWGRCWSGGGAPPYWPWIQVLRALIADRDPLTVRAELGPSAAELTQLVPEVRDLVPGAEAPERGDAEEARFALFEATGAFVVRAAAGRPLVIVLDDLHAADRSTLSLLQFVAGATLDSRVLIIATYRDSQLALERSLSDTLSELARATDCLQLVLTGLSGDDTAHFVELSAGVAPMPVLAAAIHEASSGNPLFVSELVRLLRAEDRLHELEHDAALVLPRGVDQVIARRLEHVSDPCRRTLSLAAVVGRQFDLTVLQQAGDAQGDELLGQLEEALAARVVEAVAGARGAHRFSHDLVRQTLYSALGAVERRHTHEAVARALEKLHGSRPASVVTDLAHHFGEALPGGDPDKAIEYLTLAGHSAAELAAYHEAAAYYERAAEVAKTCGAEAATVCELQVKLVEQLVAIPDLKRAQAEVEEAEALAAAAPDRARDGRLTVARAHLGLLDALAMDEDEIFDAISLFEEIGDPLGAARGWWALVVLNCGRSDRLQGGEAAERMLECARRGCSRSLTGQAIKSIATDFALGSAPVTPAIARARTLFDQAEDGLTRGRVLNCIATLQAIQGRFDEARASIAEARLQPPASDRASLESYLSSTGSRLEYAAGNFRRAEELAREGCADLESQGLVRYLSSELMFLVDPLIAQGKLEEASGLLERAAPMAAPDDADALLRQARSRARLACARGDLATAEAEARVSLDHVERAYAPDEHAECLLLLADILSATGRDAEAREAAAKALAISEAREHLVFARRARDLLGAAEPAVAG